MWDCLINRRIWPTCLYPCYWPQDNSSRELQLLCNLSLATDCTRPAQTGNNVQTVKSPKWITTWSEVSGNKDEHVNTLTKSVYGKCRGCAHEIHTWYYHVMYTFLMFQTLSLDQNSSVCLKRLSGTYPISAINYWIFYEAKCNLGEVKLERIGLRLSPIAVRDMRGGPLGSCRGSLGTWS